MGNGGGYKEGGGGNPYSPLLWEKGGCGEDARYRKVLKVTVAVHALTGRLWPRPVPDALGS